MIHDAISRQLDLVPPEILDEPINIIGAGAIGSWTALALAKMGFSDITVFDHDEVDIVNMSSQFYRRWDIGTPKAAALKSLIASFTVARDEGELDPQIDITTINERWQGAKLRGTTIMAVDSMAVRKAIFEANKGHIISNWLIDARMGAETALLYAINPNDDVDQEFYRKTLYSDAEAIQAPCTAKSTTYCALVLSGLVAKTVSDVLQRKKYLRNMTFSLKENDFLAFSKGENK